MPRVGALDDEPSLHSAAWRAFCIAKEDNSALASADWNRYRRGLRQLKQRHSGRVRNDRALDLALAEDAFQCAAHWQRPPRIVRAALRDLLRFPLGPKRYAHAAIEYWKWASSRSPADLEMAAQMVQRARQRVNDLAERDRENLERMFVLVLDGETRRLLKARD